MKQQDKERIEGKAENYAYKIEPNPSKYDAPFYTTADRVDDLEQAFIAGAIYEHERGMDNILNAINECRIAQLRTDTFFHDKDDFYNQGILDALNDIKSRIENNY